MNLGRNGSKYEKHRMTLAGKLARRKLRLERVEDRALRHCYFCFDKREDFAKAPLFSVENRQYEREEKVLVHKECVSKYTKLLGFGTYNL